MCHNGNYGQNKEEECKWRINDYFIKIPGGSFCLRLDTMSEYVMAQRDPASTKTVYPVLTIGTGTYRKMREM